VKWIAPAALAIAAGAWLLTRPAQAAQDGADYWSNADALPGGNWWESDDVHADDFEPVQQLPSLFNIAAIMYDLNPTAAADPLTAAVNERAFLDMIATAEGTIGRGDDGYNILFGGGTFTGYADHPRQLITRTFANGLTVTSSAAGRYQFLRKTWDEVARLQGLPDFSPASQDTAALYLIRRAGALPLVQAGRFADAVKRVKKIWASLPGAGYGQPEQTLERLQAVYQAAGGTVAT